MTNFTSFIKTAILACALALGAAPAFAGPMYLVTIDTSDLAETTGLLDFALISHAGSPDLTSITWTNFTGAFGAEASREGDVTDIAGGYAIGSGAGLSWLTRFVNLGGSFSVHVGFADSFSGVNNVGLAISLFTADFTQYLGLNGPLVSFELVPAMGGAPSFVTVSPDNALASVNAIPEPSELLLMLTALAMLGFATRRGRNNAP